MKTAKRGTKKEPNSKTRLVKGQASFSAKLKTIHGQKERSKAIYNAILQHIFSGDTLPNTIAHRLNMKESVINYYLKQLRDADIVVCSKKDGRMIYSITGKAVALLGAVHDKRAHQVTYFDRYCVAFRVLKDNPTCLPVEKGSVLVPDKVIRMNGKISIDNKQGYSVTRYHYLKLGYDEIHVHIGPRYGDSTIDMVTWSAQKAVTIKQEIEHRYGMVLSTPGRVVQKGHFVVNNKYIEAEGSHVTTMNDWIDESPPGTKSLLPEVKKLRGEIEYGSPEAAQAFIDAPLMIHELMSRIENLEEVAQQREVKKLLGGFTKISELEKRVNIMEARLNGLFGSSNKG